MSKQEMASTLTMSPDELTSTYLQCKICTKVFDDDKKYPRLLPCLHTFCHECVTSKINDGNITCPTCKAEHVVTSDNLDTKLPRDNTRRDLYDFVRVKRAPSAVSCTGCGKNMAGQRCKECAEFLCKDCEEAHMRVNKTKDHTLMRLDSLKQSVSMVAFCQPLMCTEHRDKVLELYCSKGSCMKPVCMMCAIVKCTTGAGHQVSTCEDVARARQDNIKNLIGEVGEVGTDVSLVTDTVGAEIQNVRGQYERVVNEIDATFNNLQEIIERGRENMKKTVKDVVDRKISTLERQKQTLKQHTKQINESMAFAEQSLTHTNSPAFLQIEKTIANRLDEIKHEAYDKEPYELSTFGFDHEGLIADVQSCIQNEAKIWTASIYLPRTEIKSDQDPTTNTMATFSITVSDHQGRRPMTSSDAKAINASVHDPSGSKNDAALTPVSDTKLQMTFTPKTTGRHTIYLTILDKTVGTHEFEVKPGVPSRDLDKSKEPQPKQRVTQPQGKDTPGRQPPPVGHPPSHGHPQPHGHPQASLRDPSDSECPDLTFDATHAHKDVSISADGKTFRNWTADDAPEPVPLNSRLQKYKGAISSRGLQHPGRFLYDMNVEFKVKKPLDKSNLVFEIGIARKSAIGTKLVVSGEKHAWSMIAAHHTDCDAICLHIANGSHILFHTKLADNKAGSSLKKNFSFTLDTNYARWKIQDGTAGSQLCVIDGVDSSEPLFPVVAGYNPKNVEVAVTLVTGTKKK